MRRREFFRFGAVVALVALFGRSAKGEEAVELSFEEAYQDAIEGAKRVVKNAKELKLDIPDEPENGVVVPIEVEVEYPMQKDRYISQIHVLTTKNRVNKVVSANYTPANGRAYLYVNAKLGSTQEVVVLARTNDGVVFEGRKRVKVAIGGCG